MKPAVVQRGLIFYNSVSLCSFNSSFVHSRDVKGLQAHLAKVKDEMWLKSDVMK